MDYPRVRGTPRFPQRVAFDDRERAPHPDPRIKSEAGSLPVSGARE
jgi:hypothetical protein